MYLRFDAMTPPSPPIIAQTINQNEDEG